MDQPGLHCIQSIIDTHQVCDSTISKVLDDPDIFHRTDKLINEENDKLPIEGYFSLHTEMSGIAIAK